jgi:hypothetical protein
MLRVILAASLPTAAGVGDLAHEAYEGLIAERDENR